MPSEATQPASKCTSTSHGVTSIEPSGLSHHREAAEAQVEATGCPQECAQQGRQSCLHSLPEHGEASALEIPRQLKLRFDPSIGDSGAFLCAPQHSPLAEPMRAPCRDCQACCSQENSTPGGRCEQSGKCGGLQPCTMLITSDQGDAIGRCREELAGDPWGFMRVPQREDPVHAVRHFQGDLLSLVSDIDEMMSCSGKASMHSSDTIIGDANTPSRSHGS